MFSRGISSISLSAFCEGEVLLEVDWYCEWLCREEISLKWLRAYCREVSIRGTEIFYDTRYLVKLVPGYPLGFAEVPSRVKVF